MDEKNVFIDDDWGPCHSTLKNVRSYVTKSQNCCLAPEYFLTQKGTQKG